MNKFTVCYIDHAWKYNDVNTGGSLKSGAKYVYGAGNKYDVMDLTQIKLLAYQINKILNQNCVIAMWATTPLADQAMEVVDCYKQFGFEYLTKFYWIKKRKKLGMGRNFRNDIEELIFLRRGNVKPFGLHIRNYYYIEPSVHSKKPEVFRKVVELVGWIVFGRSADFIELFATRYTDGWVSIGSQLTKTDINFELRKLVAEQ